MGEAYESAPATKLLATHCVVCGRALVDATSVELGIGPECRHHMDAGLPDHERREANAIVFLASLAAAKGEVAKVRMYAMQVHDLGFVVLARKMCERFVNAERHAADILIEERRDGYAVTTPFRRKASKEFVDAWREVPGRQWREGVNVVPASSKQALWSLLIRFFGGRYAKGPKGVFRIPIEQVKA